MAKITGPLLSVAAHGSIGNELTFSQRASGNQVRFQRKQKDIITTARTTKRNIFATGVEDWKIIFLGEREDYEKEAKKKLITPQNRYISDVIKQFWLGRGLTWSDLGQMFSQSYILSLAYLGNGICLAGTYPDGKILRSTNYGANWSDLGQMFSQAYIRSVAYLGNGICLAGTDAGGKILRSVS